MTEHSTGSEPDRLAAHERLSTGALASMMRAFAAHPWRVVLAWLGIIAALIVLVATVGGGLKDEFEIPGSDTQKATDLIESEFTSEQGAVLNLVFAAPEGQRLDTPARKAAVEAAIAKVKTPEFAPHRGQGRDRQRRRPVRQADVLEGRPDRLCRGAVLRRHRDRGPLAGRRRRERRPRRRRLVGRHRRVQRRRRVPADPAGHPGAARLPRGVRRPAVVFRTLVATAIPHRARDRRRRDGLHPALHPRGADRHQHDHPDPRVDDRDRRRHRLLALHRHALPAVPPRGARAARRRPRRRARRRAARCSSRA